MITPARHLRNPVDEVNLRLIRNRKYTGATRSRQIQIIRDIITKRMGYDPCVGTENQERECVTARQLFIYFVMKYMKITQRETGKLVNKDHATVIHAIKCVKLFTVLEQEYRIMFEKIDKEIKTELIKKP